jgi:hypothetical protein
MDFTDVSNIDNELLATINFYDINNAIICNFNFDTRYMDYNSKFTTVVSKKPTLNEFIKNLTTEFSANLSFQYGNGKNLSIYSYRNEIRFRYSNNHYESNIDIIINDNTIKSFKKLINLYDDNNDNISNGQL